MCCLTLIARWHHIDSVLIIGSHNIMAAYNTYYIFDFYMRKIGHTIDFSTGSSILNEPTSRRLVSLQPTSQCRRSALRSMVAAWRASRASRRRLLNWSVTPQDWSAACRCLSSVGSPAATAPRRSTVGREAASATTTATRVTDAASTRHSATT